MTAMNRSSRKLPALQPFLLVCATLLLALPVAARSEEAFYDRARVLEVTPIEEVAAESRLDALCEQGYEGTTVEGALRRRAGDVRAREPGIGLAEALREDLRLYRDVGMIAEDCRSAGATRTVTVIGYRVRYEYGGRTYERRMTEDPGEWVNVRVRIGTR
jgi:uncharacterized protein YqiB (DUF1249 family)